MPHSPPAVLRRTATVALTALALACPGGHAVDFARMQTVVLKRFGAEGAARIEDYRRQLPQWQPLPVRDKLDRVNEFFNRNIRFDSDPAVWHQADYWATPAESLGIGAGDCEDFAIAKYVALKTLGVPVSKLRMTYVRVRIGGPSSNITQAHMVLTYYETPAAEPLVLDNLLGEIRPASRRPDLMPVFSFNNEGLWTGASPAPSPVERLSRWVDLVQRMHEDGSD
ncbi:MAG TPA: transglutaminase-like cysteine peptidase [Moraxellaceae bacterium]|nr:transglutaminase-like cysteine peptidase [Moraxellaceae bacterium]